MRVAEVMALLQYRIWTRFMDATFPRIDRPFWVTETSDAWTVGKAAINVGNRNNKRRDTMLSLLKEQFIFLFPSINLVV